VSARTILIVGGTSGIGLELAKDVIARGDKVVITGRDDDNCREIAEGLGPEASHVALDISEPETIAGQLAGLGRIHGLVLAAIERVIDHGEELDIEVRMVDKAGQVSWIAARGQASEDHHIVGVSMDITERKNADMQAVQDRAMLMHLSRVSTVGQLSAAIAHQLNQPLTAIRFNTEAAQKMLDRPDVSHEELKEVLEDVNAENTRAADIIRNLSALYRRGPLEAAAFDLNDLVLETLKLIKAELVWRHVTVRLVGGLELPRVRGSRIQLQQVLLNLLLNGMQAMTDTPPDRRLMIIRTVADDRSVQVWIEDRGKGIAQGEMGRIFDPFWTTKEQGIGVGLAISRAIVEAHGGTISADNLPEGGAVFWMTLPISGAAEELEQS